MTRYRIRIRRRLCRTEPDDHFLKGIALLTRDGEVWTWGMMLGGPRGLIDRLQYRAIKLTNHFGYKGQPPAARPVIRPTPWQLPHPEPDTPPTH